MDIQPTALDDVLILKPQVFGDHRGFFLESFNQKLFAETTNSSWSFVQDNHSRSTQYILRGLHYQTQQTQGKLVRVVAGEIFDVAVDLRRSSPTFGQWVGEILSAENNHQLWIPPGFAHGFLVLSPVADVLYKVTDYYAPHYESSLRWDDPSVAITWPLPPGVQPILSQKDSQGFAFPDAPNFP
ncbi:dTDP-4-dehydrorhamnose 3,5-epimerase [Prochlorothrix hollandica]|uniref:dTDP-4-dehydrorhamnose 3,5-epimerase n=1 Tax=Prochlorothrix hollandica TaxID=1223 RepID=UPI0033421C20